VPGESPFTGKIMEDTSDVLYRWDALPRFDVLNGDMKRAGFRSDHSLMVFNWIKPGMKRPDPHSHPFDQIVLTVEGSLMLEVEGETMECGPRSVVRVPADVEHTGWPLGDQTVLNIDVFAPPREDYLFLVEYQKDYSAASTQ
jgi:mannose-6-phosphate isomerase-like protein (cupin superfamily)